MFQQLRVHTPAPLTPDGQCAADQAAEMFTLSLTPAGRGVNEAGSVVAPSAATGSEASLGATPTMLGLHRAASYDMTQPPTMISDTALGVENSASTVMGILPYSQTPRLTSPVTDLQGPPSERTQTEKLRDLKKLARQYARDQGSCDDTQISYLETLEDSDNNNLRLAWMLAM
jgi:hypothetical protein